MADTFIGNLLGNQNPIASTSLLLAKTLASLMLAQYKAPKLVLVVASRRASISNTARQRRLDTFCPDSSSVSLTAHFLADSPGSMKPPGNSHTRLLLLCTSKNPKLLRPITSEKVTGRALASASLISLTDRRRSPRSFSTGIMVTRCVLIQLYPHFLSLRLTSSLPACLCQGGCLTPAAPLLMPVPDKPRPGMPGGSGLR